MNFLNTDKMLLQNFACVKLLRCVAKYYKEVEILLENFLTVGHQVLVLFILMSIGVAANRFKLIDSSAVNGMTNVVLYFVTPCVIIASFQREANPDLFKGLLFTGGLALLIHLIFIAVTTLVIHDENKGKEKVLRFAAIFSNCGFMSLPIQEALLGDIGVFYGSVYVAVFNVVLWTYGLAMMSGTRDEIKLNKLIFNPGIIGILIGTLVFVFQIDLPAIISSPVEYMASLNTPLPMVIIGYYLGDLKLRDLKSDMKQYPAIGLRLVVLPLLAVAALKLSGVDNTIAIVCTIASCAPAAAVTAMFANRFDRDARLAAQMVSVSTLFSLVTIPLMVALVQQ